MNNIAAWVLASGTMILGLTYPQEASAQGFTGAEFATWSIDGQDSYIQASLTMAGIVFTQTDPEISTCLDAWYLGGGQPAERNTYLRETIAAFPEHHPGGTLLAVILQECGPID